MTTRTVTIDGIKLDVTFSYYAGEPANREYPGCPEEYEILSVFSKGHGIDIMSILSDDTLDRIVKELEKIKGEM